MRSDTWLRLTALAARRTPWLGLLFVATGAAPLGAQRAAAATVPAVAPDSVAVPRAKSATIAFVAGSILPGSAHWYAGENGRGWLVAAVYWTGAAIVMNGRTDRVGVVGGVAFLGAYGVSILDGIAAVRRYNRRVCGSDRSRCRE